MSLCIGVGGRSSVDARKGRHHPPDFDRYPWGKRAMTCLRPAFCLDHEPAAFGVSVPGTSTSRAVRHWKSGPNFRPCNSARVRPVLLARTCNRAVLIAGLLLVLAPPSLAAPATAGPEPVSVLGIPVDFILFASTLLGVALFHHHTLQVALAGLAAVVAYKLAFTGFKFGTGVGGLALHMQHEWVILANLFLLLMGFAL